MIWIMRIAFFMILFKHEGAIESGIGQLNVMADSIKIECSSLEDSKIAINVTNYSSRAIVFDTLFEKGSMIFNCEDTSFEYVYIGNVPEYEEDFHNNSDRGSGILQPKTSKKFVREANPKLYPKLHLDFYYGVLGFPNKLVSNQSTDSFLNLMSTHWITASNFICEAK